MTYFTLINRASIKQCIMLALFFILIDCIYLTQKLMLRPQQYFVFTNFVSMLTLFCKF